jgi:hypothetical protein
MRARLKSVSRQTWRETRHGTALPVSAQISVRVAVLALVAAGVVAFVGCIGVVDQAQLDGERAASAAGTFRGATTRNLLLDPGFELGDRAGTYWQLEAGLDVDASDPYSQFRALRFPGDRARSASTTLPQLAAGLGSTFVVRGAFRALDADARGSVSLYLRYLGGDGREQRVLVKERQIKGTQWRYLRPTSVTLPSGAAVQGLELRGQGVLADELGVMAHRETTDYPLLFPIAQTFRGLDGGHSCDAEDTGAKTADQCLADYDGFQLHNEYSVDYVERLATRYPARRVIKQIAFGTIQGNANQKQVHPSYWLYYAAKRVEGIELPTASSKLYRLRFVSGESLPKVPRNPSFYPDVALVALDVAGKPDFSSAVHFAIEGKVAGVPRTYEAKLLHRYPASGSNVLATITAASSVVALPHVSWTAARSWEINLDPRAPKVVGADGVSHRGLSYYVDWVAKLVRDHTLRGLQFDLPFRDYNRGSYAVDIDNDLVGDHGYTDGINVYGLGMHVFIAKLRAAVGPEVLINLDGEPEKIRTLANIDGIQIERFIARNFDDATSLSRSDANAYRRDRFGHQFNQLRYYTDRLVTFRPYSYAMCFADSSTFSFADDPAAREANYDIVVHNGWESRNDFIRVGLAANTLLGLPHSYAEKDDDDTKGRLETFWPIALDEYYGGAVKQGDRQANLGWLGRPTGALRQHVAQLSAMEGVAFTDGAVDETRGFRGSVITRSGQNPGVDVEVDALPSGGRSSGASQRFGVAVDLGRFAVTGNRAYTLVFEAKAAQAIRYGGKEYPNNPRSIRIRGFEAISFDHIDVLADKDWRLHVISFKTRSDLSKAEITLRAGFGEQVGWYKLRNVRFYSGSADRFSRQYEDGAVLLNMTAHRWRFAGAEGYRRLEGHQSPVVNSGAAIEGAAELPAYDGLFLRRE